MSGVWANDFREILPTLAQHKELRSKIIALLPQPMPGKVTQGDDRAECVRGILLELVGGELAVEASYGEVARQLPRGLSMYGHDNRVFASGWEERLIRTQLSRFYNQATLELILAGGEDKCFVPHSRDEDSSTPCSRQLAGREHDVHRLHGLLVECYTNGNWLKVVKIPDHPHCTHVVRPIEP